MTATTESIRDIQARNKTAIDALLKNGETELDAAQALAAKFNAQDHSSPHSPFPWAIALAAASLGVIVGAGGAMLLI